MPHQALIVGCGFTGRRTARLLLQRGWQVVATSRAPERLRDLQALGARVIRFDAARDTEIGASADGAHVLLSVPTLRLDGNLDESTPRLVAALDGLPQHLSYISTTGVYGSTRRVDASTPVAPATDRQQLRVAAERAVQAHPCKSVVLRPAAIYGPGRGVHAAMREGRFQLPHAGNRVVSRIHVDDLAAIVAAAIQQQVEGSYPVADNCPATSGEVAQFCADLLGLGMPATVPDESLSETRRVGRRVDGSAIRRVTGVDLRYPSYREGTVASLATERER